MKNLLRSIARRLGLELVRRPASSYPPDFSQANIEICRAVSSYTMTSPERLNALVDAVRYVVLNQIEGALVECGVWKGGSAMAMMLTLKQLGDEARSIFLYDTFSGMSPPDENDVSFDGTMAVEEFARRKQSEDVSGWCASPIDQVRKNIFSTGYRDDRVFLIKGKVEETIPETMPKRIALLRLDTDWYESTKHELLHLFPLVEPRGVIIIDDYGHWKGCKKAVDEYFAANQIHLLLNRVDYTGRVGIK